MSKANLNGNEFPPICKTDIEAMLSDISGRFGELALLFKLIGERSASVPEVALLSSLGRYMANDFESVSDSLREQIECGGIRHE